jgi:glycosyltransferase involved in cell wall biosynthesis
MRIVYITAGAAGMYCGSCMRDNTLVSALHHLGHDALLLPTYTPIRTDEEDISQARVFFGGINVYLQQKSGLFRHTPWFLDRLLDGRGLLNWVSRFAVKTQATELGDLTLSMLKGDHGHQRKEIAKLAAYLADEVKPEVINLTNAILSGMVPELRRRLKAPILCSLQGDDIFLESLPEPYHSQALALIRDNCKQFDGFIATSAYYADFMADYFAVPRSRIHVIHPGLNLHGHGAPRLPRGDRPPTIGYFARICPEKGLHHLVEAFIQLRQQPGAPAYQLRVSGWLGENNKAYFADLQKRLENAGLHNDFTHVESPDHASKVRFFHDIDILSVPTTYREPKGLYILEALANGVPVVQPGHGSFPELIDATGGGVLVVPHDPADLARGLRRLLDDPAHAEQLATRGKTVVHEHFHAQRMAEETAAVYAQYIAPGSGRDKP